MRTTSRRDKAPSFTCPYDDSRAGIYKAKSKHLNHIYINSFRVRMSGNRSKLAVIARENINFLHRLKECVVV